MNAYTVTLAETHVGGLLVEIGHVALTELYLKAALVLARAVLLRGLGHSHVSVMRQTRYTEPLAL